MTAVEAPVRPDFSNCFVKHRWWVAIGFAVVPVLFTALGSVLGQVLSSNESVSMLFIASAAAVSALVGLLVMKRSLQPLKNFGFRVPRNARAAWWLIPPLATVVFVLMTAKSVTGGPVVLSFFLLSAAVAVNEEIWFRGIILLMLRPAGIRIAIVVSSALFGVLHLANFAGGIDPGYAILQVVFALLFGVVSAELMIVTGSLWPAIAWHAAWDFVNLLCGDVVSSAALVGVGLSCTVMLVYAVRLWGSVLQMRR